MSTLVWSKRGMFDPRRASTNTFADRIVENGAKMFVRTRRAKKRGGGRVVLSLDDELHGKLRSDGTRRVQRRGDTISVTERARHLGLAEPDKPEVTATTLLPGDRDALRAAILALPEHLQPTVMLLREGMPAAAIAREQGRSRRQVANDLAEIRERLGLFGTCDSDEEVDNARTP